MKSHTTTPVLWALSILLIGTFAPSFASAGPQTEDRSHNSSELADYSLFPAEAPSILKWTKGKLIYPLSNSPELTSDVFILSEIDTPAQELPLLYHHFGVQFSSRHQAEKAREEFDRALQLNPDIPYIHKRLGDMYLEARNYRRAEGAFRKTLKLDPGNGSALSNLGITLAAQKKYRVAEKSLKRAIQAEPDNPDFYVNLGHFYFYLKKNFKGARTSYRKALKLNPELREVKSNLRTADRKIKKWKNRENHFKKSWGVDFDYDDPANSEMLGVTPSDPEENNIAGSWEEQNTQRPLF